MTGNLLKNGITHFNRHLDMREIVEWFKQARVMVSPARFEAICQKAYEELPFEKWIVLKTVLHLKEPAEAAA